MQKKNLFYIISSIFLISSCETKSDIRVANDISSIRVNVADSFNLIDNLKDELLIIKGDLEKQKFDQEDNLNLENKYISLKEENENLKANIEELKINFEKEINTMKDEFNKAIENLRIILTSSKKKLDNNEISGIDIDTRYKKALELYNQKQYLNALEYFKTIVGSKSKWYDERARFYYGNSLYNLNKFEEAVVEMHDLFSKYPKSTFISKALIVQADSFLKLNMTNEAKSTFQEIVNKFPNSTEANIAKQKLGKL